MSKKGERMEQTILKDTLQNSITLIKNTKGYNWEIKLYFEDGEKAVLEADKLDRLLKDRFRE